MNVCLIPLTHRPCRAQSVMFAYNLAAWMAACAVLSLYDLKEHTSGETGKSLSGIWDLGEVMTWDSLGEGGMLRDIMEPRPGRREVRKMGVHGIRG